MQGVTSNSSAPISWSAEKNVSWKTAIPGSGHSSPVVSGNNVIVTTAYPTEKNGFFGYFKEISKYLILALAVLLCLVYFQLIFRTFFSSENLKTVNILNCFVFSFIFGFIIYFSLTAIVFHIKENTDHITQTIRWFFSGMIFSLGIILSTFTLANKAKVKIIIIIISLLFTTFILLFRPAPEYYLLTEDGFLLNTTIKALIIPIFIAIILFCSLFFRPKLPSKFNINSNFQLSKLKSILLLAGSLGAFLLGIVGIGIYKLLRYDIPVKDFTLPSIDLYYRDGNVFIALVFLCLFTWFIFYLINDPDKHFIRSKWFVMALSLLLLLVFVRKNYFTIDGEYTRAVVCLDKTSGKIKWIREALIGDQPVLHAENSPASPTSVIAGEYIYSYFGKAGLLCTDMNGNIIWENTELPFEDIHGVGASPNYYKGLLIILSDMNKAPYITAIDGKTGKFIWKKNRKPWDVFHGAYRTPLITTINGKDIIITWGMFGLIAYELNSGAELFNYHLPTDAELVASMLIKNDTLYAPDLDNFHALSISRLIAGENPILWETKMQHKGPICSSPTLFNNLLFMISDNGFASCIDASNGTLLWSKKLNGNYLASCSIIGNRVYFSNTSGLTTVVAAEKKFRKIAENNLPEPIYASFAISNNQLFIRTTKQLWCLMEK